MNDGVETHYGLVWVRFQVLREAQMTGQNHHFRCREEKFRSAMGFSLQMVYEEPCSERRKTDIVHGITILPSSHLQLFL